METMLSKAGQVLVARAATHADQVRVRLTNLGIKYKNLEGNRRVIRTTSKMAVLLASYLAKLKNIAISDTRLRNLRTGLLNPI